MVKHRLATEQDIRSFYGCVPFTMKAVAILVDGACLCLITLLYYRGKKWMCADYTPAFEPCLKRFVVLRAAKLAMSLVKEERGPVYALADNKPLLERLGFVPYEGDIYQRTAS